MNKLKNFSPALGQSFVIAGLFFAGSLFFGLLIAVGKLFAPQWPVWNSVSLSYLLSMIVPFAYIIMRAGKSQDEGLPVNNPSFGRLGAVLFFLLSMLAGLALSIVIEPATSFIPMPESVKAKFEAIFMNSNLIDSIISTCILAPLCEEFLCRGVMMRGMLSHTTPCKAIVWAAFIFALLHANPWQAIPAFLLGLFLGWTYFRSGCIWVPVALHCLNNSVSTVISRTFPELGVDAMFIDLMPGTQYAVLYVTSLAVFVAALYILNTYGKKTLSD